MCQQTRTSHSQESHIFRVLGFAERRCHNNLKSTRMEAVLDYGLPGIAAVGAGLLAYAFTGGEEEYPSQVSDVA